MRHVIQLSVKWISTSDLPEESWRRIFLFVSSPLCEASVQHRACNSSALHHQCELDIDHRSEGSVFLMKGPLFVLASLLINDQPDVNSCVSQVVCVSTHICRTALN